MQAFDPGSASIFADGDYLRIADAEALEVRNPATLEPVGRIAVVPEAVLDGILARARLAQRAWARVPVKERAARLHEVAHSMKSRSGRRVCELLTREMGKPYPESEGEVRNVAPIFEYYAELAKDHAGTVAGNIQPGNLQFKRYDPYGISAHILPYNYPLLILAFTVAASLAAGNAVVIKPSPITSLSTLAFMEHFQSLPPGLVTCVTGGAGVGAWLVESSQTDVVAFTGSVDVAREINVACARQMKPCVIEAGGNDPIIVSDRTDADFAAAAVTCSSFHLSGQICTSTERIYVVEGIYDAFMARFVDRVSKLRVGDGMGRSEIGPLASKTQRDRIIGLVERAVEQGAVVETGGRVPKHLPVGWFYEPTILSQVRPDMDIMQREVFGPIAPVCRVRSVAEGIELANRSLYGLGASILTADLGEAMLAIEELDSGMVWVNNPMVDNDALPFGGRKMSGIGRELGREGLDAFRQVKFVTLDPSQKPYDWWYPYPDSAFQRGDA